MRALAAILILFGSGAAQAADLPMLSGDEPASVAGDAAAGGPGAETFAACQQAIAEWAKPYAPVDIETVSVGPVKRHWTGKQIAPLFVRVVYEAQGGFETKRANVECTVDRRQSVSVTASPVE